MQLDKQVKEEKKEKDAFKNIWKVVEIPNAFHFHHLLLLALETEFGLHFLKFDELSIFDNFQCFLN